MPGSRRRKKKLSNTAIVAGLAALVAFVGVMAGAAWFIIYKPFQIPSIMPPLPDQILDAGVLAEKTRARFSSAPLNDAGRLRSARSRPTSYGTFYSFYWGGNSGASLIFEGMNVQITSGTGSTEGDLNGLGNLILGYNENTYGFPRTGTHTLVVGKDHGYTSRAGMVVGARNRISGLGTSVSARSCVPTLPQT